MADELPQDTPVEQITDSAPPARIKRKRVRQKKKRDLLDPYEYLAEEFGKELAAPVDKLPADCKWYAWKGPADAAALFFDVRQFQRFDYVAQLKSLPKGAETGVVFF